MNDYLSTVGKPFAESCEENKQVILSVLKAIYLEPGTVVEIGSGTGQHAIFFANHLAHLHWQPTDREENLAGIRAWLADAVTDNIRAPLGLDVQQADWPLLRADYIFSANTVHIMSWVAVQAMFRGLANVLEKGGLFALYGPFNYDGAYTSDSNARFDQWLKQRDPLSGIRDFTHLNELAHEAGMRFMHDYEMPANNRILVWQKD